MPLASHRIVLIASLIFDDDQVEWLRPRIVALRTRLLFESALELMAPTRLTRFEMGGPSSGMPEP